MVNEQGLNKENERITFNVAAVCITRLREGVSLNDPEIDLWDLEFLMAEKNDNTLTFPGGKYGHEYPDETAVMGAQRELAEETGVSIPLKYFKLVGDEISILLDDGTYIRFSMFSIPQNITQEADFQDTLETQSPWRYYSLEELAERGDIVVDEILRKILYIASHIFIEEKLAELGYPMWD